METIKSALAELSRRAEASSLYHDYYAGNHRLQFATPKFRKTFGHLFRELKDNLCSTVVDVLVDRLEVVDFSAEMANIVCSQTAWNIWQRNRMESRAAKIHREAFIAGDSFLIVWTDQNGRAVFYPQSSNGMVVHYDDEQPGRIVWAAKLWKRDDHFWRLNLYFADRIEKYTTKNPGEFLSSLPEADAFVPFEIQNEPFPLVHNFGLVPVFHFAHAAFLQPFGTSVLRDLVPLQDALNKALCDMFVAMEFVALPQRWVTGLEVDHDPATGAPVFPFGVGVDRVWTTGSTETRFGQFEATALDHFLDVQNNLRQEIGRVAGMPFHYWSFDGGSREVPSGAAIRAAESRFAARLRSAQSSFGDAWAGAMRLALDIETDNLDQPREENCLTVKWTDAAPQSEREHLETLLLKQQLGADSNTLLAEAGYTAEDLAAMK